MEEQGKVAGFLSDVKAAEVLTGLVEDVRDSMMDYQVCAHTTLIGTLSKIPLKTALQEELYSENFMHLVSLVSLMVHRSCSLAYRLLEIFPFSVE